MPGPGSLHQVPSTSQGMVALGVALRPVLALRASVRLTVAGDVLVETSRDGDWQRSVAEGEVLAAWHGGEGVGFACAGEHKGLVAHFEEVEVLIEVGELDWG